MVCFDRFQSIVILTNLPHGIGQKFALQELRISLTLLILTFKFEPIPDALNSMAGFQRVLRVPKQSFVRLSIISS